MIKENVKKLLESIEELKYKKGIKNDIAVVAATKYADAALIEEMKEAGLGSAGENRAQDLLKKYDAVHGIDWQFIGRLQTNKVKYIADKVSLIQSVDRLNLAEEIDRECFKRDITGHILIEVNIGGEFSKGGVDPRGLFDFAGELLHLENLRVSGLMCVAPITHTPENNRKFYLQMAEYYDILNIKVFDKKLKFLSMGMSGDYLTAIECGANMIRPGSIIFKEGRS
jgi:pyridoxal phosphate enzyme (YggS family)